jgi:hypothetical protein
MSRHCCDHAQIQLCCLREQADEAGAIVSRHRFGIVADGLGGENISHRTSADSDGSAGKIILVGRGY